MCIPPPTGKILFLEGNCQSYKPEKNQLESGPIRGAQWKIGRDQGRIWNCDRRKIVQATLWNKLVVTICPTGIAIKWITSLALIYLHLLHTNPFQIDMSAQCAILLIVGEAKCPWQPSEYEWQFSLVVLYNVTLSVNQQIHISHCLYSIWKQTTAAGGH